MNEKQQIDQALDDWQMERSEDWRTALEVDDSPQSTKPEPKNYPLGAKINNFNRWIFRFK